MTGSKDSLPPVCILAGGLGTRLGEHVRETPKPLLEVAGEPFLVHQLRLLARYGATRAVLCVGYLGELIEERSGSERFGIEVLYSYDAPELDGTLGAIYSQNPPLANAARPPGAWQCYDIIFHAPHFDGGKLASPARMTALLNGVLVQDNFALIGATVHGAVGHYTPHPAELPLAIQDHGNPESRVSFRNIWVRRLAAPK